ATACAIAALAAPWGALAAGSGALVFATYHLAGGAWQAGQRDFLLCLFLLLGALGVARWLERGRLASLVWSGAALGAGITVKPHVALFAGALAAVVAVAAARAGVTRRRGVSARHVVAALGLAYGLAHYVVQGKGWEYHLYPLAAFAAVLVAAELPSALAARRRLVAGALAASLVAALVLLG